MKLKDKISNFWYYYKVPFIIAVCVLVLVIYTISTKMNEVKYDHSVAIISEKNYPDAEGVERIRKIFEEKYGGTFDVVIYNLALGELYQDETKLAKLDIDLRNKISEYFFIEDMETFKKTTADIEFSDVALVKDISWLNNLGLDNFYFCIRK